MVRQRSAEPPCGFDRLTRWLVGDHALAERDCARCFRGPPADDRDDGRLDGSEATGLTAGRVDSVVLHAISIAASRGLRLAAGQGGDTQSGQSLLSVPESNPEDLRLLKHVAHPLTIAFSARPTPGWRCRKVRKPKNGPGTVTLECPL